MAERVSVGADKNPSLSGSTLRRSSTEKSPPLPVNAITQSEINLTRDWELQSPLSVNTINRDDKDSELKKLREDNQLLQDENYRLGGKLRGYQTLNELFQESRENCQKLKKENETLNKKLEMASSNSKEGATVSISDVAKCDVDKSQVNPEKRGLNLKPKVLVEGSEHQASPSGCLAPDVTADSDVAPEEEMTRFQVGPRDRHVHVLPMSQNPALLVPELPSPDIYGHNSIQQASDVSTEEKQLESFPSDHHNLYSLVSGSAFHPSDSLTNGDNHMTEANLRSIHVADDLNQVVQKAAQLEENQRRWKVYAATLQTENQEIKKKFRKICQEKDNVISKLKIENLKHQARCEKDKVSSIDTTSSAEVFNPDWVHVNKQQLLGEGAGVIQQEVIIQLETRLEALELKNKQLLDANKAWEAYKISSEAENDRKYLTLQEKLCASERALTEYKIQDEKRQCEIDKILISSKKRYQEVEEEKEELLSQLHLNKNTIQSLQGRVRELCLQLQQAPMNQLSAPASPAAPTAPPPMDSRYEQALQEAEIYKHQLNLFKEDFDKERSDRACAQSEKDELKKKLKKTEAALQRTQAQQKTIEESLQSSLSQNEQLHQQIGNFRRQVTAGEESKRKLMAELDRLRREVQDLKMKLTRQQDMARSPPPMGRPYYPPLPYMPQGNDWQGYHPTYHTARPVDPGPELLPGSWQCSKCTFVNYPQRSVCEVCGTINLQRQHSAQYSPSAFPQGQSAWPQGQQVNPHLIPRGFDDNDLVTDAVG